LSAKGGVFEGSQASGFKLSGWQNKERAYWTEGRKKGGKRKKREEGMDTKNNEMGNGLFVRVVQFQIQVDVGVENWHFV
jgi:hypothetical protein